MWNSYPEYCKDMKRLKTEPLPEEIWRREYAPKDETYREPLIIRPKKPTVRQSLTVEKSDHIREVTKKVQQPKKPKAVKQPPKQSNKPHIHKRTSLAGMTPEEIKKHRAKLAKNRLEIRKKNGWKAPPRTAEQRKQRNAYFKDYYADKKNDPEFMLKRSMNTKKWRRNQQKSFDQISAA